MYVPVADRGVEVPPKRLEIRGINMDKNISVCCKVMFKNVKCGKISTKLREEGIWTVSNLLMFFMSYILLSYGINIAFSIYNLLSNIYPPF